MSHLIAIIEDETILRDLVEQELEKSGYETCSAPNGELGWAMIKDRKPDLILLDLLMPVMSGYDVLTELRKDEAVKATPCIVISNSGQIDDLNRAYSCGADDVLIKADFNPSELAEKIERLLAKDKEKPA